MGWIGVDLDGTLAHYDKWRGATHIGEPIEAMVRRVKTWVDQGEDVRILTARVSDPNAFRQAKARKAIRDWCNTYLGFTLPITHSKDFSMIECWDDRSVTVERNTGRILGRNT